MRRKQSSTLPVAGVASAAIAVAAVIFTGDTPYIATRPAQRLDVAETLPFVERVNARLWQDPFAAVADFEEKESERIKFEAESQKNEAALRGPAATAPAAGAGVQAGAMTRAPVGLSANANRGVQAGTTARAPAGSSADANKGVKAGTTATQPGSPAYSGAFADTRYGKRLDEVFPVIAQLAIAGTGVPLGEVFPVIALSSKAGTDAAASIPQLTILAVAMPGNPYVGGEEARRRERYAVVSALGAADYEPKDAEHIGYMLIHRSELADASDAPEPEDSSGGSSLQLPFEIFERTSGAEHTQPQHVLVLWMDDTWHMDPHRSENWFAQVRRIVNRLAPCSRKNANPACDLRVIGPYGSDRYANLAGDHDMPGADLAADADRTSGADAEDPVIAFSPFATSDVVDDPELSKAVEKYAHVIPTIPRDSVVLQALVDELQNRAVTICDPGSEIVLLSEWDTQYGRRSERTLRKAIESRCHSQGVQSFAQIRPFSFVRGLDGALLGAREAAAPQSASHDASRPAAEQIEWPETADQRDYVRRLGEEVYNHQRQTRAVKAIGIMATDTHDKLLLLQALRQRFPELPFFTTDADARLVHPAVHRWTGNLIVASGYGLSLQDKLQSKVPPFRDVYQTSTYLATLMALQTTATPAELTAQTAKWTGHSELFEVGRSRLVRLKQAVEIRETEPPGTVCDLRNLKNCARVSDTEDPDQLNTREKWVVMLLIIAAASAIAISAVTSFRRQGGAVNAAPSGAGTGTALRQLAFFLLALLGSSLAGTVFFAGMVAGAWQGFQSQTQEPGVLTQGVSSAPVAMCWCFALAMTIYYLCRIVTTTPRCFADLEARFLGASKPATLGPKNPARSFFYWTWCELRDRRAAGSAAGSFAETWMLYKHHSFSPARPVRIFVWWLIMFYLPMNIITPWMPTPEFPIRGEMHNVLKILAPAGFMSLMVLMAVVADTVLLCSIFVIAVGRQRNAYPRGIEDDAVKRYALLPDLQKNVDCLLDTEVIGARTSMVADYLYYPFVVLAILALGMFASQEHWARWPGRFLIISLSIGMLTGLWLLLRWAAEHARASALDELDTAELRVVAEHAQMPKSRNALRVQCRILKNRVEGASAGAYAAVQDQPIVRAVLLPISGAGAAQLWEYLTTRFP